MAILPLFCGKINSTNNLNPLVGQYNQQKMKYKITLQGNKCNNHTSVFLFPDLGQSATNQAFDLEK